ncbi:hypothetical protein V3C41_00385 [Paenarthrobacter nicotinovorans]|uniref:Uncharacterized protein n=1 Tax=Paenarthrobacter nicotinovorans TaxID=29320 RepID=A0ABV0GLW3_PAENI
MSSPLVRRDSTMLPRRDKSLNRDITDAQTVPTNTADEEMPILGPSLRSALHCSSRIARSLAGVNATHIARRASAAFTLDPMHTLTTPGTAAERKVVATAAAQRMPEPTGERLQ